MSVLQCIMDSDSKTSDLEATINGFLADLDLASMDRVTFQYGSSKNRISVNYTPGENVIYASKFEILALNNSKIGDLADSFNQQMATEGSTSASLCPTSIDGCYGDGKNRAVVSMAPSSISGSDPSLVYCVASSTNSNITDLQDNVDQFITDNTNYTIIDVTYFYGDDKNRALILYAIPI